MSGEATETPSAPSATTAPPAWKDRGWWIAFDYGVVAAKDRFLRKLPQLRKLGRMKELLEPGGKIVYRNLFLEEEVKQAWQLVCELQPWKQHVTAYIQGEEVPFKEAHDVLWCAGFLAKERPCRPRFKDAMKKRDDRATAWLLGCDVRLSLAPGGFADLDPARRHVLTFGTVDTKGLLRFDRPAIATFLASGERGRRCPLSAARDPEAVANAIEDVSVRALGWPIVVELEDAVRSKLGARLLEAEHGFILKKGAKELEEHEAVELRLPLPQDGSPVDDDREVEVRRADDPRSPSIAREVRIPKKVRDVLAQGVRLRGVRIEEGYVKARDGKFEVEEKFVLSTRFHLGAADDPARYQGYKLSTVPRGNDEWLEWVERIAEAVA